MLDDPSPYSYASSTTTPPSIQNGTSKSTASKEKDKSDSSSIRSVAASALSKISPVKSGSNNNSNGASGSGTASRRPKTVKKKNQKWWRINDEKCREARTGEVLDMEREVYLLFYELEADD
jgi:ubiquitin carboxyl-terminal hydrolase 16